MNRVMWIGFGMMAIGGWLMYQGMFMGDITGTTLMYGFIVFFLGVIIAGAGRKLL